MKAVTVASALFGVLLVLGTLIAVFVIVRIMARRHSDFISLDDLSEKGVEEWVCPRCGEAMTQGFVMASRGIAWRDAGTSKHCITRAILANTMNFTFTSKENLGWRCSRCNLVVVDHNYLVKT